MGDIPAKPIPNLSAGQNLEAGLVQSSDELFVIEGVIPGMIAEGTAEPRADNVSEIFLADLPGGAPERVIIIDEP